MIPASIPDALAQKIARACHSHPCPWHSVETATGVIIKDCQGATVLALHAGVTTRMRKREIASLIVTIFNAAQQKMSD